MEVYPTNKIGHTVGFVPENIPDELKTYDHWVAHRNKEPYDPKTGGRASTTDSRTWAPFLEALDALESGAYDGIGFVFSSGDPYVGVDLDGCRDPETGEIGAWACRVIDTFADPGLYVEVSPSGRGVHLITRGVLRDGVNTKHVEVYGQCRFFRMSGRAL